MLASAVPIWPATAWTLWAAAFALGAWALLWDRSRGRPRCPRCWYSMTGALAASRETDAPALRCPECGKQIRSRRGLFRTRRRWRWAGASILLVAAGYESLHVPRIRAHGLPGAIPTTALVLGAPWCEPLTLEEWLSPGAPATLPLSKRIMLELSRRLSESETVAWQRELLARHICRDLPDEDARQAWEERFLALVVRTDLYDHLAEESRGKAQLRRTLVEHAFEARRDLPVGSPVIVSYPNIFFWKFGARDTDLEIRPLWNGGEPVRLWRDGESWRADGQAVGNSVYCLGAPPTEAERLDFEVIITEWAIDPEDPQRQRRTDRLETWSVRLSREVRVGGEPEQIVTPHTSEAVASSLREHITPRLLRRVGETDGDRYKPEGPLGPALELRGYRAVGPAVAAEAPLTLGVILTVLRDDKPVAISRQCWTASPYQDTYLLYPTTGVRLTVLDDAFYAVSPASSTWTLVIEGEAETALRDLDAIRFWDGRVTFPLAVAPPGEQDIEQRMLEAIQSGGG